VLFAQEKVASRVLAAEEECHERGQDETQGCQADQDSMTLNESIVSN
jgi:hypothetical protein